MSAFLTIGGVCGLAGAHQDALFVRVLEKFYTAYGNLADAGNLDGRQSRPVVGPEGPAQQPEISGEHAQAGEGEELGHLPASDIALVGGEDREFLAPQGFFTRRSQTEHRVPPA